MAGGAEKKGPFDIVSDRFRSFLETERGKLRFQLAVQGVCLLGAVLLAQTIRSQLPETSTEAMESFSKAPRVPIKLDGEPSVRAQFFCNRDMLRGNYTSYAIIQSGIPRREGAYLVATILTDKTKGDQMLFRLQEPMPGPGAVVLGGNHSFPDYLSNPPREVKIEPGHNYLAQVGHALKDGNKLTFWLELAHTSFSPPDCNSQA